MDEEKVRVTQAIVDGVARQEFQRVVRDGQAVDIDTIGRCSTTGEARGASHHNEKHALEQPFGKQLLPELGCTRDCFHAAVEKY